MRGRWMMGGVRFYFAALPELHSYRLLCEGDGETQERSSRSRVTRRSRIC